MRLRHNQNYKAITKISVEILKDMTWLQLMQLLPKYIRYTTETKATINAKI